MKKVIDGAIVDLEPTDAKVCAVSDRLLVHVQGRANSALAVRQGDKVIVSYLGKQFTVEALRASRKSAGAVHNGDLVSPMPGVVVEVLVQLGQVVVKGDKLIVLEAMKTQQAFTAPFDGKIAQLSVSKGEQIAEGLIMASVEPSEGSVSSE